MEDEGSTTDLDIISSNSDKNLLAESFTWPDGSNIEYDLDGTMDRLVIKSYNGKDIDGDIDRIPFLLEPVG